MSIKRTIPNGMLIAASVLRGEPRHVKESVTKKIIINICSSYSGGIHIIVLTHPNDDEYSAQLIVSTSQYYRFQCAEVADMKASTGNKLAVVRWCFHEGQSRRSARLPFMEAKRKYDSQCESCALNSANQAVTIATVIAWFTALVRVSAYYSGAKRLSVRAMVLNYIRAR